MVESTHMCWEFHHRAQSGNTTDDSERQELEPPASCSAVLDEGIGKPRVWISFLPRVTIWDNTLLQGVTKMGRSRTTHLEVSLAQGMVYKWRGSHSHPRSSRKSGCYLPVTGTWLWQRSSYTSRDVTDTLAHALKSAFPPFPGSSHYGFKKIPFL